MTLKPIGYLGDDIIAAMKAAKLMMIPRNGEVWLEEADIPKAEEIIAEYRKSKKAAGQSYNIGGVLVQSEIPIVVSQQGYPCDPSPDRTRISVWMMAKPRGGLDTSDQPKMLKKISISKKEIEMNVPCYHPSYRGVSLADDTGFVLFEVLPFNVFVLWNTTRCTAQTKAIFEELLKYAIVLANHRDPDSRALYDDVFERQRPKREDLERVQFEKMCAESLSRELATTESSVKTHIKAIEDAHKTIFDNQKALNDITVKVEVLRTSQKNISEKAKEEWAKLKSIEKTGRVRKIEVNAESIRFETGMITWKRSPTSEPIELGEYACEIGYKSGFKVKIENLTKKLDYGGYRWEHPHCHTDNLCMGNMTQAMPQFAASREFEALIMCMLKWLQNVDTKDAWGQQITYWEEDHDKRKKKAAPKKPEGVGA